MKTLFSVLFVMFASASVLIASSQPYAGQQDRDISTLSPEDVDALLAGSGWGFALPAELNGYPGPTHVLEMADALGLTAGQVTEIEAIRVQMSGEAQTLGADYVAAEMAIDSAFEAGEMTPALLANLTASAAQIEASLRAVHLGAHLAVTPLLTRHQIVTYNRLRGYDGASGGHGNH